MKLESSPWKRQEVLRKGDEEGGVEKRLLEGHKQRGEAEKEEERRQSAKQTMHETSTRKPASVCGN